MANKEFRVRNDLYVNGDITATGSINGVGSGDMQASTYDPQGINGDAFLRTNHTGDLVLGTNKATSSYTPTADIDLTNKLYVDSLVTGLDVKKSCRVATTGNIVLNTTTPIDGVTIVAGDRVLVKDQTNATENGIYVASESNWSRAEDADNSPGNEVSGGMYTFIEEGTTNAETGWVLSSPNGDAVLGTDDLIFTKFSNVAAPVQSVNGKTGAVTLTAVDVNAVLKTGDTMSGALTLDSGLADTPGFRVNDSVNGTWGYMDMNIESLRFVTSYRGAAAATRLIIDASNGRVGVNTLNPVSAFDVNGNISSNNYGIRTAASAVNFGEYAESSVVVGRAGHATWDNEIGIRTNNVERIRIKNDGKIGIGTNAPSKKLHVVGDTYLDGSLEVLGWITDYSHSSAQICMDDKSAPDGHGIKRFTCNDGGGNFVIRTNSYYNTANKYAVTNSGAADIVMNSDAQNGTIQLRIANTGTADNNITYSNTLTFDNNGLTLASGTFNGTATQAQYADLAEIYTTDQPYEVGTVVEFGGDKEITIATEDSTAVAGVISTDPAFLMNKDEHGLPVALRGRVPCKVKGKVKKGQLMVSAGDGFAKASTNPMYGSLIGKALENFDGEEGVIEVVIV